MSLFLGWDIGGTKCAVVKGRYENGDMKVLERVAFATPADPYQAVNEMIALSHQMSKDEKPEAVGISCGSPLSSALGTVQSPPNLPGWHNIPVVKLAEDALGMPAALENDANACALAEWQFGAGRGLDNVIFFTFGTGMGAGIIANGALLRGACDMAGEIGHVRMCDHGPVGFGKPGAFEGFCSGSGLAQMGKTVALARRQMGIEAGFIPKEGIEAITARVLADAARAGDADALDIFHTCGDMLGKGLAIIVDILNPQLLILGSLYVRCKDLLEPHLHDALRRECLPHSFASVRVVAAQLDEAIGDYAALTIAHTVAWHKKR